MDFFFNQLYLWLDRHAKQLFVISLFAVVCLFVIVRVYMLFLPIPTLGGVEGNVIFSLQRFLAGYDLYDNPEKLPFAITQYSPVYYYVVAFFARLVGIGPDDLFPLYHLNRFISLVFNGLTALVVYAISRKSFENSLKVSVVLGCLAFILIPIQSMCRPDSLYNLVSMLAIFCFLNYVKFEKLKMLIFAMGLAVFVVFCKQSGIFQAPMYIFFIFCFEKNIKKGLLSILLSLGFFAVFFFVAYLITSEFFLLNVVQGIKNGIDLGWWWKIILLDSFVYGNGVFRIFGFLSFAIGIFLAFYLLSQKGKIKTDRFLGYAIGGFFLTSLVFSLKDGSTPSYFAEFWFLSIVGAYQIFKNRSLFTFPPLFLLIAWALFLIELVPLGTGPGLTSFIKNRGSYDYSMVDQEKEIYEAVKKTLDEQDKILILNESSGGGTVQTFLNSLFYEHVVFPNKDIVNCCAFPLKSYDYSEYFEKGNDGLIKYIIRIPHLESRDPAYLGLSFDNFDLIFKSDVYSIYEYHAE